MRVGGQFGEGLDLEVFVLFDEVLGGEELLEHLVGEGVGGFGPGVVAHGLVLVEEAQLGDERHVEVVPTKLLSREEVGLVDDALEGEFADLGHGGVDGRVDPTQAGGRGGGGGLHRLAVAEGEEGGV